MPGDEECGCEAIEDGGLELAWGELLPEGLGLGGEVLGEGDDGAVDLEGERGQGDEGALADEVAGGVEELVFFGLLDGLAWGVGGDGGVVVGEGEAFDACAGGVEGDEHLRALVGVGALLQ